MRHNKGFSRWDSNHRHPSNFPMPYHQNSAPPFHNHPGSWSYNGNAGYMPQYPPANRVFRNAYQGNRNRMPYFNNFNQDPYVRDMGHAGGDPNFWNASSGGDHDWNRNVGNHENDVRNRDFNSSSCWRQQREESISSTSDDKKMKENDKISGSKTSQSKATYSKNEEARRKLLGLKESLGLKDVKFSNPNNNRRDQNLQSLQDKKIHGKNYHERFVPPPVSERGLLGPPPELNRRPIDTHSKYNRYNKGEQFRGNKYNDDEEDESNEINSWLQQSKGKETLNGKSKSPVSTDPLPGSEEARSNAIKETTDRLKQALQQKKNEKRKVNVNELLSSGDEAKSENPAHSKLKTYPKNLAELELDASDMREIGRANTEKNNCLIYENSDDDVVEVERPPSPPRPIIDLDSPMKSDQNGDTSSDRSDSEGESYQMTLVHQNPERSKERACSEKESYKMEDFTTPSHIKEITGANEKIMPTVTNQITHRVSYHKVSSSRSSQETVAPSGRISLCRRPSTESELSVNKSLPNHSKPTSPSNMNQRRRSISSSSSCKTPSPHSSRKARSHQQSTDNFVDKSPPFNFQDNHDLRQRKIIRGLQKMSRSKLKDLIENPGIGKYEFAVRELVKEHRAALSKESRDFAEKRIPAEVLNPKSTELPPDDSTLLADYEIDWSQLSEGLISTLGDLMQDFESESEEGGANEHLLTSNEPTCERFLSGAASLLQETDKSTNPKEDDASLMCIETIASSDDDDTVEKEAEVFSQNGDISAPGRIRVRQFASMNNLDFREMDETYFNLMNSPNPNPILNFSDAASEEADSVVCLNGARAPDTGLRGDLSEGLTHHEIPQLSQPVSDTIVEPAGSVEERITSNEARMSNGPKNQHSSNARNLPENDLNSQQNGPTCDKQSKKAGVSQGKETKNGKGKQKQRKFVHLEERSWFQDVPSRQSITDNSEPSARKDNARRRTTSQSDAQSVIASTSNIETRLAEVSDVISSEADQSQVSNEITSTSNMETYSSDFSRAASHTSLANDVLSVDRDGVSMLPVLMMTVSASALSDTVCNMSPSEMQKRIMEIDTELQNLVQERFLLSQALKAAQSSPGNVSSSMAEPSPDKEVPSHPQPRRDENRTVLKPVEDPVTLKQKDRSSKRKRNNSQANDEKQCKKKKSESWTKKKTVDCSVSANQSKGNSFKDCFVRLESISPNKLSTKLGKNTKGKAPISDVVIDHGDDDSGSSLRSRENCGSFSTHIPSYQLISFKFQGVEGTILDIKIDNYERFFAASQNGQVFMISQSSRKVLAVFGEENPSGITCIETVRPFNLYTGSGDGILRIYNYQDVVSKPQAKSSHSISNGIHCMEANWDFVYIGTKTGSVIPFNTKTLLAGEPLCLGGYPVLSIKCSMEGPRKVLIVASRQQPIAIRDATSGLLLRSIGGCDWTVYSIELEKSQVFCGSASDKISVFDFQSGEPKYHLQAGKGVVDMKFYDGLLFCACYDGKIYVFDPEARKLISSFDGPGKMSLCLTVYKRKIICGSKDQPLTCYIFPRELKHYLRQLRRETLNLSPERQAQEDKKERKRAKKLAKLQEILK